MQLTRHSSWQGKGRIAEMTKILEPEDIQKCTASTMMRNVDASAILTPNYITSSIESLDKLCKVRAKRPSCERTESCIMHVFLLRKIASNPERVYLQ